ncbi:C40 family peptidase [Micromonospora rifamycinica]|uniref:Cell wall-associated hydrolase, NlpC family n=1 Tax=Micromonospora rifamycinica TaxID=291594 RepID=A0A109IFJ3_9ACTN|nr:C40 family peptidase [Micromonospora rifamycinica]KWV29573.1 glycoside hydrolase [Micromonospora rifamycinica]SCG68879.1 Cell wall-associated hydrolase, NlpC family [Micromonospora rifamycinica]
MVDSGHGRRQRRRRSPLVSPVLRPALWSALLGAVAAMVLTTPAYAEPPLPNTVPDTGSRPVVAGGLQLPGAPTSGYPGAGQPGYPTLPVGGLPTSPLLSQIDTLTAQNGQLADQLLQLQKQRDDARVQLTGVQGELTRARSALTVAEQQANAVAANAFKAAAALPPGELARDLHGLSVLQRVTRGEQADDETTAASGELSRARTAEQVAAQAVTAATDRVRRAEEQFAAVQKALRDNDARIAKLRADNQAQLIALEKQQEAAEQKLGAAYVEGQSSTGMNASPQALAAVRYALAQLGDPYLWAAEGPDRFDCSGLMWAAYRSAGYYDLPRVARDQYYATRGRTVAQSALLPGDLLFFASGSSWTTIHHVAMYIGNGRMVQAPRSGDVVKISQVRWSGLYAATRVVGAVSVPGSPITQVPTPTPKPTTPSPKPTTPSPKPTTPSPKPTTPTPTPRPTGGSTKPPTKPPVPTPTPTPTKSVAPTPSVSGSGTPETSATPTTAVSTGVAESSRSASAPASTGS